MINKTNKVDKQERVVLVALIQKNQTELQIKEYLAELAFLSETAGAIHVKSFTQRLPHPDAHTFIGKGKVQEIVAYIQKHHIDAVIFDDELNGSQLTALQKELSVKILDRTDLILDIFARRAKTAQAKIQVSLAQYQYLLPRLKGMWSHLERQGGGIGTRGPGETEIETDRRIVKNKISLLQDKLKQIEQQSYTQRQQRNNFIRIALVGYTNVGKSTLMNVLSKSDVFAENKLFATLDTTTRKVVWDQIPFLLSDTVGFIRKLPHHLIESFKSTLEEVRESDLLLHVVDISHPQYEEQIKTVLDTLHDIKIDHQPIITVFNKLDQYVSQTIDEWTSADIKEEVMSQTFSVWKQKLQGEVVFISATKKLHLTLLKDSIKNNILQLYKKRYPHHPPQWIVPSNL